MSSSPDFIMYVCDQLEGMGIIRSRKMFGEYMVYVDDKPILLVCDDTVFVKMLPVLDEMMKNAERGYPYKGAKEHYLLEIENKELVNDVVSALLPVTAVPKPRKKKKKE